jgi:quinoprotein glucose dehydrogenase
MGSAPATRARAQIAGMGRRLRLIFATAVLFGGAALSVASGSGRAEAAAAATSNVNNSADPGDRVYREQCSSCHGGDLGGTESGGPALVGSIFTSHWGGKPAAELFAVTKRTMPRSNPGGLSDEDYTSVVGWLLRANGLPAGNRQAPTAVDDGSETTGTRGASPSSALTRKHLTEWLQTRGDYSSTSYSALALINRDNVKQLRIAWRWKSENFGATPEYYFRPTPVMADGVLYSTAGSRRDVVAIDARTGETLWMYRLDEGARGAVAPRLGSGRGLAFWRDAQTGAGRVLLVSPGFQLIELDARTGQPIPGFGNNGRVDLKLGLDRQVDTSKGFIGSSSPPLVVRDVIVVGSAFPATRAPRSPEAVAGNILGYDVRTGERKWTFHTVPGPGEWGNDTWKNGSWQYTGNSGAWAPLSADVERGLVYLPITPPTVDHYGGYRLGNNAFSDSLVCLDAATGRRVWHFQMAHHDLWDYDPPAPPVLLDITVNGKKIPAVAQVTKEAFVFVFDRVTGKPVWPIKERRVPKSDTPGEQSARTQPFPTKPAPFDRQGFGPDDVIDFTPEIKQRALEIISHYRTGPIYSPPSVVVPGGNRGTLTLPGLSGGANWEGAAVDPETGILYVGSMSNVASVALTVEPKIPAMRYVGTLSEDFRDGSLGGPFGLPLVKPPWSRITAINLNTGEHVWMVPNSDVPDSVRNNPALRGVNLPRTGSLDQSGLLVTKTLLFAGEGSGLWRSGGGGGNMFRSYDKLTGEILSELTLPANQTGVPMTYEIDGRQFIVLAIGARGAPGELVALTVP